jgi:hypothetical protein
MEDFSGQFSDVFFFFGWRVFTKLIRRFFISLFFHRSDIFSIKFMTLKKKILIRKFKFKIPKTKMKWKTRIYGKHDRNRTYFCSNTRRLHYIKEIQIKSGIYHEHFEFKRGLKSVIIYIFFLEFCLGNYCSFLFGEWKRNIVETKCMTKMEKFAGSRKVAHILKAWSLLSTKISISSRSVENSSVMSHSPAAPPVFTNSAQIFFPKLQFISSFVFIR